MQDSRQRRHSVQCSAFPAPCGKISSAASKSCYAATFLQQQISRKYKSGRINQHHDAASSRMSSKQNGVTVTLSRTFCVLYAEHPTDRHPEESRQPNMFQQAVMVEWKVHLSIGVCTQAAEPCTGEAPYKVDPR